MKTKWKAILLMLSLALLILAILWGGLYAYTRMMDMKPEHVGQDWRSWRGYSEDYTLQPGMTVTVAFHETEVDGRKVQSYGVYNAQTGAWYGNMVLNAEESQKRSEPWLLKFRAEDRNGDGRAELGIPLDDGSVIWFSIERSGENPDVFPRADS